MTNLSAPGKRYTRRPYLQTLLGIWLIYRTFGIEILTELSKVQKCIIFLGAQEIGTVDMKHIISDRSSYVTVRRGKLNVYPGGCKACN